MRRRVVITGAGVICAIGSSTNEFWDSCLAGRTRVERIPDEWDRDSSLTSKYWSPLASVDFAQRGLNRGLVVRTDPVSLNAICAAREALESADFRLRARDDGWEIEDLDARTAGVYMGTGIGGASSFLHNHLFPIHARYRREVGGLTGSPDRRDPPAAIKPPRRINPFIVSMLMPNAVSAALGLAYRIQGPNTTYSAACASGTVSIGHAFRAVGNGVVNVALAGGSEFLYDDCGYIFSGFDVAGTLANGPEPRSANRPFDRARTGFLFSQGAAVVLVLEELDHALARDASFDVEIVGYGESFDAHSIMSLAPDGGQIPAMIRAALDDARVDAAEVDYINAHGTGTANNDAVESLVIKRIFGTKIPVNSTKSLVGHTIGASGALEAVVTMLSLRDQTTHRCLNLEDPEFDLNFVTHDGPLSLDLGLSQSFAFGGHNAGLVLRRYDHR